MPVESPSRSPIIATPAVTSEVMAWPNGEAPGYRPPDTSGDAPFSPRCLRIIESKKSMPTCHLRRYLTQDPAAIARVHLPGQSGVRGPSGARRGPVDRSGAGGPTAQHQDDRERKLSSLAIQCAMANLLTDKYTEDPPPVLCRMRQRRLDRRPREPEAREIFGAHTPTPSRTAGPMPTSWPSGPSCTTVELPRDGRVLLAARGPRRARSRRLVQANARPVERGPEPWAISGCCAWTWRRGVASRTVTGSIPPAKSSRRTAIPSIARRSCSTTTRSKNRPSK